MSYFRPILATCAATVSTIAYHVASQSQVHLESGVEPGVERPACPDPDKLCCLDAKGKFGVLSAILGPRMLFIDGPMKISGAGVQKVSDRHETDLLAGYRPVGDNNVLGSGSFGTVREYVNAKGEHVAIKSQTFSQGLAVNEVAMAVLAGGKEDLMQVHEVIVGRHRILTVMEKLVECATSSHDATLARPAKRIYHKYEGSEGWALKDRKPANQKCRVDRWGNEQRVEVDFGMVHLNRGKILRVAEERANDESQTR